MERHWLALVLATTVAAGCGRKDDDKGGDASVPASGDASQVPASVRVCKVATETTETAETAAPAALALQSGVTYAGDLYPVMETACSQCHRGDIENRQNSTNCYYMKDHIDNLIARLDNAVDAAAYKAANPTATDDEIRARYPNDARPMPPLGRDPLAAAQIDLFRQWRDAPNKCEEGQPAPDTAAIPVPKEYSSDLDETSHQSLEKIFATAGCEDGPSVNTDANWSLVASLMAPEPDAASAFYDYAAHSYVPGAAAADHACDFDSFIASLADLEGVEAVLRPYEAYGWRMTQCAVVDGYPLASMVTLSRTTNTLGDKIIGLNFKTISIKTAAP